MRLKKLCDAAGIYCPAEYVSVEVTGIETDSRLVRAGGMFICIRGLHTDGHSYVAEAIERGAACILTDRYAEIPAQSKTVFLQCADTRAASAYLYDAWNGFPSRRLKLIGVTGTNGKTTVSHLIRAILEASLYKCGLIGTVGAEALGRRHSMQGSNSLANMTTPDPKELYRLLREMEADGVEYVVMEVSSHALFLEKLAPLQFECAIFTNLTPEHLDFHGTMEHYAEAKARLLERAKISVINADSPYAARMRKHVTGKCITCSEKGDGDYHAEEIRLLAERGCQYRLASLCTRLQLVCPIAGRFTVMNSMQAAVAALELGCNPATVKSVLASVSPIKGRMERVRLGPGADLTVMIDYAHTPDALETLLGCAKEFSAGRLVLVFGCGGDRDRTKRAPMGEIAARLADLVIVTSDNSRSEDPMNIIEEIVAGIPKHKEYRIIPDRERAIRYAILNAQSGDTVLLAGKGHEEYEITRAGRRRFCEREIALAAFAEREKEKTENTEG